MNSNKEKLYNIIYEILKDFNISIKEISINECESINEILDAILDSHCIMYEKVKLNRKTFLNRNSYIIAFTKENYEPRKLFKTLLGYSYWNKDINRNLIININDFNETAYIIHRPLPKTKNLLSSLLLFIYRSLTSNDIIIIIITTFIITLLSSVVPQMHKIILNEIDISKNNYAKYFIFVLIIYISAGIGKTIFSVIKNFLLCSITERISLEVQSSVITKLLIQKNTNNDTFTTGNVYEKIKNARSFARTIINEVFDSIIVMLFTIIYILQIKNLDNEFFIPFIFMISLWIIISISLSYKNVIFEKKLLESKIDTNSFTYQTLKGIQKIKESGIEDTFNKKLNAKFENYIDILLNPPLTKQFFSHIINFILSLISVTILFITVSKNIKIANYIAFTSAFGLVSGNIQQLIESITSFFNVKPIITQLDSVIKFTDYNDTNYILFKKLNDKIEFRNINCSYISTNKKSLNDFNLTISKGEKIAIVGESGAGKSTVLRVLLGIEKPTSGEIFIDGISTKTLNLRSLRKKCGTVFQFSTIIPGTIKENIAYGLENVNDNDIYDILEKVGLEDFVNGLHHGIYTVINESSNSGLSGGQIQRLLLAKALFKKPDILLLDEATSALDNITQAKVFDSIYKLDITTIIVAHRLSTIKFCDRIIILKNGHIVESGKFNDLINSKSEFYNLVKNQKY